MPSSFITLKEGSGYQPLLLAAFTFQVPSGTPPTLLVSTHPFNTSEGGPSFPGIGALPAGNYLARVDSQNIDALQYRSSLGIDRFSKVTLKLNDADSYIWTNYVTSISGSPMYGFRGASLQLCLVFWQPGTTNFSSDAPIMFTGTCDMQIPQQGATIISVTANNAHNTGTVMLPSFPIQNRCPHLFPANAAQRALAVNPFSIYGPCGYSPDQPGGVGNQTTPNLTDEGQVITDGSGNYIMCDYLRSNSGDPHSGCMPRLGNAATTSIAPDGDLFHDTSGRVTGNFAGIQWSPGSYYQIEKNYTSNQKIAVFSFMNSAILGQYQNLLIGTQWVNPKLSNILESGNDTKCVAMICTGNIGTGGVLQVVVNGISLNRNPSGDNNLWWDFVSTGGRNGGMTPDSTSYRTSSYRSLDDPYGSIAAIECVFYKDIFTGFGIPTVQVLASGPQLTAYYPIATAVGNGASITVTLPAGLANNDVAGNPPYTVTIFGNSWGTVNGTWELTNWTYGPPGTITLASSAYTGSGTGGYIQYTTGEPDANTNPAWALLLILTNANWQISEIDLATFSNAAIYCATQISYVNSTNQTVTHARFKICISLEQRRTAAELIAGIVRATNGYFAWSQTGLLQFFIEQTLADGQPAAITGSNYNTAVTSVTAANTVANGYVAYSFDETNIARIENRDGTMRLDIEGENNTTVMTPNEIYIGFQDEDNQYVVDSLSEIDAPATVRSGGALQPGGSLVPETLNAPGITNFDQGVRIANMYMATLQRGNEADDPRGTNIVTIGTTVKCSHLRTGHLVFLTVRKLGWIQQLFRVVKIAPSTDYQSAKLTLRWHNDVWYTDIYGQNPQAIYSETNLSKPQRVPLPWQANAEQPSSPNSGTIFQGSSQWTFQLAEVDLPGQSSDGASIVQLQIGGMPPVNSPSTSVGPPLVPVQATTSSTGGYLVGGVYLMFEICATDSSGNFSAPSQMITVAIPTGTNTNVVTINNLGWQAGTTGYVVFGGRDHFSITRQLVGSGTPSSISIPGNGTATATGLYAVSLTAPPDLVAYGAVAQAKTVIHSGLFAEEVAAVDSTSITLPNAGTSLANLAGYNVYLLGRQGLAGANLPIVEFTITSNSASSGYKLVLDRNPSSLIQVDDLVTVGCRANISSSTTIGDVNIANAYYPSGANSGDIGDEIIIMAGTGIYQHRIITAVTGGNTYTVDRPWDTIPDSTSIFITVEATWRYSGKTSERPNARLLECGSMDDHQHG